MPIITAQIVHLLLELQHFPIIVVNDLLLLLMTFLKGGKSVLSILICVSSKMYVNTMNDNYLDYIIAYLSINFYLVAIFSIIFYSYEISCIP